MNKGTKILFFLIIGVGVVSTVSAINSYVTRKKEERELDENKRFIESMRKKYKDIKNFEDFHEAVKYVENPVLFGYDLRLLKNIKNLEQIITMKELKYIYEIAKVGLPNKSDSESENLLNIMEKIFK